MSEAKLLVRYILDTTASGPPGPTDRDQLKSTDSRSENLMNSEVELLTSFDLAEEVAREIGVTNILPGARLGGTVGEAAQTISLGLHINKPLSKSDLPPKGNVIHVAFEHQDPTVARNVVAAVIAKYQRLHARVHGALDGLEELAKQEDQKRAAVETTEAELRRLKSELGITTVLGAQKSQEALINSLQLDLASAQAQFAEFRAMAGDKTNLMMGATSIPAWTAGSASNAIPTEVPEPTPDVRREFQSVLDQIETVRKREQQLLLQFNPESYYIVPITKQLVQLRKNRDSLIAANPGLTNRTPSNSVQDEAQGRSTSQQVSTQLEYALKALASEAKAKSISARLEKELEFARRLADKEPEISRLERKLEIDSKEYAYFASAVQRARVDENLSNTRLANISVIQQPSPAVRDNRKRVKTAGTLVLGGIGLGIGLAMLIELVLDTSIRHPSQITGALKLKLFISIPRIRSLDRRSAKKPRPTEPLEGGSWLASDFSEFSEALRDRLIMFFQLRDLHHKPRLIGVTGFSRGAGVTSIATSLAAALSDTGEGSVLYVDVTSQVHPSIHPFRRGKPVPAIEEALTESTRDTAQVHENLYAVTLSPDHAGRVGVIPRIISNLVPQMKASNYDYIIFDLPPVSQTSITARVAGLLDVNVVVVESEKTHCRVAEQAAQLLLESNAQIVAVLNKHSRYLPERLDANL